MTWINVLATLGVGAVIGSILTWVVATRDLALRRRTQTIDAFLRVATQAHGVRPGQPGHETVGIGEQVAAIHLLADLARRDRWLRKAGIAFLDDLTRWMTPESHPQLHEAAAEARATLYPKPVTPKD